MSAAVQNEVELRIAGESIKVWENYTIELGVLTQPNAFSMTVGHGREAKELLDLATPGEFFELLIDGYLRFVGYIDGATADSPEGMSPTRVTIRGRCPMQFINDKFPEGEKSLKNTTFAELVKTALDDAHGAGKYNLLFKNADNRKLMTGSFSASGSASFEVQATSMTWNTDPFIGGAVGKGKKAAGARTVQCKLGQRWWDGIVKPELDRGGLFLWSSVIYSRTAQELIPTFVLGAPDLRQKPLYEFRRLRTAPNEPIQNVNVISATLKNETTERFSRCEVHFRSGGASKSREASFGVFVDDEMTRLGFNRPLIIEDKKCKSLAQATFLARRRIAAANRKAWQYTVVIAGHLTERLGSDQMVVVAPDTIASIRDDEFGIHQNLWIESARDDAQPQARTTIKMMRIHDCAFGEPDGFDVTESTETPSTPTEPEAN